MNYKILLGKYCSSFFSQFDVLSKEVKLYSCLTNKSRHQTAFGGFLSLIAISLMLVPSFFMFTSLFIRTGPKAYEVTKFVDDSPKISFNNENSFFILRFHSRYTEIINETSIQFYGEMRTVKAEKTIKRYGFDPCNYKQHFQGVEQYFSHLTQENVETHYLCLSKMFLNES